MLGTISSFCLMAVGARELSGEINTLQILFLRGVIALSIITTLILATRRHKLLRTARLPLHGMRNLFHLAGQYGWFVGIGLLPLAEVFALEFTVPLWTLIIATLFLGEQLSRHKIVAALLGFAGVVIIVKPSEQLISPAALIVLAAALCYAISHSSTKALAQSEHPLTIVFFMCAIQLPLTFILALFEWQTPQAHQWAWLVLIGITALSAHYCMTKAMQCAEVTFVVTMDFLRLPMIALVGVLLYSEPFELNLIVGAFLMLVGNLISLSSANKQAQHNHKAQ